MPSVCSNAGLSCEVNRHLIYHWKQLYVLYVPDVSVSLGAVKCCNDEWIKPGHAETLFSCIFILWPPCEINIV